MAGARKIMWGVYVCVRVCVLCVCVFVCVRCMYVCKCECVCVCVNDNIALGQSGRVWESN